jgi:hypothetical protein
MVKLVFLKLCMILVTWLFMMIFSKHQIEDIY